MEAGNIRAIATAYQIATLTYPSFEVIGKSLCSVSADQPLVDERLIDYPPAQAQDLILYAAKRLIPIPGRKQIIRIP